MKKTLIAMAVLAVSSASFAQATITGSVVSGYKASTTAPSTAATGSTVAQQVTEALAGGSGGNTRGDAAGLGLDTTTITFAVKEDLGGGMSMTASMNIDALNRASVAGGDSFLALVTSVGQVKLETYRTADYLSGDFSAGGVGMDNKVFPARTFKDAIGFTTKLGPIFLGLKHAEQGTANTVATAAALGLGVGAAGAQTAIGQRLNSISATYVDGGLVANLNYLAYDNRTDGVNTSYKDVIRTGATYDLGSAKLGGGVEVLTLMSGATLTNGALSGSMSFGNLTLGANFATETAANTAAMAAFGLAAGALDQTRTGYGLKAEYALSKRTSVVASFANWLAYVGANRNSETNLLLSHSF